MAIVLRGGTQIGSFEKCDPGRPLLTDIRAHEYKITINREPLGQRINRTERVE